MGKDLILKGQVREHTGSKAAERVRKTGRIPAIIYGHKKEPVAISVDRHNFEEGLHHGRRLMDVLVHDKKEKVLVRDIQYDYLGRSIVHADLLRVDVTEMVTVEVPIELKGTAKGAEEGGIVSEHANSLEIECRATDIPENIVVSVKEMKVGDAIHASEIELPKGVRLVSDAEILIATCSVVTEAPTTEEIEEEEPAAPEVIGEAKEEEAEEPKQEDKK